jgi:DNA-binding transcriptional regulator YhcF (GntR family)
MPQPFESASKKHMTPVASSSRRIAEASSAGDSTRKIVRTTTVELVTTAIRQRILSGDLAPGEVLRQEALADELGVSRVPVREAITRLVGEGLLTKVPHKGAYVAELSIEEVQETFEIRLRLEPWLFSQAIPHISDAEARRRDGSRRVGNVGSTELAPARNAVSARAAGHHAADAARAA